MFTSFTSSTSILSTCNLTNCRSQVCPIIRHRLILWSQSPFPRARPGESSGTMKTSERLLKVLDRLTHVAKVQVHIRHVLVALRLCLRIVMTNAQGEALFQSSKRFVVVTVKVMYAAQVAQADGLAAPIP